ncbi:sigma-70 family RNA polymerase sigma factor [Marinilabilia sp.]|uniref:RNA polymerase sigma factor n=1 Tax=Marinilabilia sp. TaxID=2021252 RepID=UPI0025B87704|nr:sigma-70 family RNA polymerase sigma factor [Marinilabilia sp.]
MKTEDEKHIIKKIKQGDVSAYSVLIDKYRKMVYTLVLQILKNESDAEEVAQDAFFKAYKALDTFEGRSSFSTWIYRIAYRQAISKLRRAKNKEVSFETIPTQFPENETPGDILLAGDRSKYLKEGLKKIKGDEANLLTLFYYEEKKVEEIAEITGLSPSNVKVKLFRARQNLLKILQSMLQKEVDSLI